MAYRLLYACLLAVALLAHPRQDASAATLTTLYRFCAQSPCLDGSLPEGGVVPDASGTLYGTAAQGGYRPGSGCDDDAGCGAAFALQPNGTYTVIYSFCARPGCVDGNGPTGPMIFDAAGNLYGVATYGGGHTTDICPVGCGVVFRLSPGTGGGPWTQTVLYSFCADEGCADGFDPVAGLVIDAAGNLYGTTLEGGLHADACKGAGCGLVFKLTPGADDTWSEQVLYRFCARRACADGESPRSSLIFDAAGNLYGTTALGGAGGHGTVFRVSPDETETVLYGFCAQPACADGADPAARLMLDAAGTLYGTTPAGGANPCAGGGCGTVFALAPDGTQTVLHSFEALGPDHYPDVETGLVADGSGRLYGAVSGIGPCGGRTHPLGCYAEGALYELRGGKFRYLSRLSAESSDLIIDGSGRLYGTTVFGGNKSIDCANYRYGCGTVFALQP